LFVSFSQKVVFGSWKLKMMLNRFVKRTLALPLLEKLASLAEKQLLKA